MFLRISNSSIIFSVFIVILSPTSFCAKRASNHPVRIYFYGWHRPQSFPSTSWYSQSACCPPYRPFIEDSGTIQCTVNEPVIALLAVGWFQAADRFLVLTQWSANENQPQTWRWTSRRAARGHLPCFPYFAVWRLDSSVWWVCVLKHSCIHSFVVVFLFLPLLP